LADDINANKKMKRLIRRLISRAAPSIQRSDFAAIHEQNFGCNLIEWEERAERAVELLKPYALELGPKTTVADWGCGHQTIRRFLPRDWHYIPYDRVPRSPDTCLVDFNKALPGENADVIFCLGLLEYVDDFWRVLGGVIATSRFSVFSYVGPADEFLRKRNGWKWNYRFDEIGDFLEQRGSQCLDTFENRATARIYLVRNKLA
jgi:hypothetical protein